MITNNADAFHAFIIIMQRLLLLTRLWCLYYTASSLLPDDKTEHAFSSAGEQVALNDLVMTCPDVWTDLDSQCTWAHLTGAPVKAHPFSYYESTTRWATVDITYPDYDPIDIVEGINHAIAGDLHRAGIILPPDQEIDGGEISKKCACFVDITHDPLAIPVFVVSNPSLPDRRAYMEWLLRSVGFSDNITFMPFTRWQDVRLADLKSAGRIDDAAISRMLQSPWIGPRAIHQHVAAAIDHLSAVRAGLERGCQLFAVMEDDLILAGSPCIVNSRISKALGSYPPSADMLYLESCFDTCSERSSSNEFTSWARTTSPNCAAAIVFTRKGARRILQLCKSIFWGIDNMYPQLIHAGLVDAYVLAPRAFIQDGFWASQVQSLRTDGPKYKLGDRSIAGVTHRPFVFECSSHEPEEQELLLTIVQVSALTAYLRDICSQKVRVRSVNGL